MNTQKTTARSTTSQPAKQKKAPSRTVIQITATSAKATFEVDDRPSIRGLGLAGPRRAREGRGGATAGLNSLRFLIRYPGLSALQSVVPARTKGRPPAYPDLFWFFYLAAIREFAGAEKLGVELETHWDEVCKEFYFEHNLRLPLHWPGAAVLFASFNAWRKKNLEQKEGQIEALSLRFIQVSAPLARAVRAAESNGVQSDLLNPKVWDCVAADGTVLRPPSDVHYEEFVDDAGAKVTVLHGSRAKVGKPRDHAQGPHIGKKGAPKRGMFNVAATTKGLDTYTRTVLSVEAGDDTEGEVPVATRALTRLYDEIGHTIPVLLYDGGIHPKNWQELLADYGVFCVNPNKARAKPKHEPAASEINPESSRTGHGKRQYGLKAGAAKYTFTTPLPSVSHEVDSHSHLHHLAADDGTVYEVDRPVPAGGHANRVAALTPVRVERLQDSSGEYYLHLTVKGVCTHGRGKHAYEVSYDLRKTELNNDGHVPQRSPITNIRVIPEADELFAEVYGKRNQIESYFSWMKNCYRHKDRAASWGRERQTLDLIGAATLHNAETWAHLAYRHPQHADRYAASLRERLAQATAA